VASKARRKAPAKKKRNASPKRNASTKKAPRGKVWRKGYVSASGKRVKGGWVKKPRKNPIKWVDGKPVVYTATVKTPKGRKVKAARAVTKGEWEKAAAKRKAAAKKKPAAKKPARKKPAKKTTAKRRTTVRKKTRSPRYYKKRAGAPKGHVWRKGHRTKAGKWIPGMWVKKPKAAKKRAKPRKRVAKRKTARKTTRKAARTPRYYRKKSGAPRGHVWRKGYTIKKGKNKGKRVPGMWVKKGGAKKRRPRRKVAYKRKKAAPKRRLKKGVTVRPKSGPRYRVKTKAKRYKKKTYLRKRAKRYSRRYPGKVWRKGYVTASGKRVKGQWVKKPRKAKKARRMAANKGRRRTAKRSNPYRRKGKGFKGGKKWIKPYSYKTKSGKIVHVKGHRRKQWYPTRYPKRGKGSRWISQSKAYKKGLLGKMESRRYARQMGFAANPAALAMLPTRDQLMAVGQAAGVGFLGFAGGTAAGVAFGRLGFAQRYLGTWAPVVGNVLAGIGMWTAANMIDHPRINEMKPFLAIGAGVSAFVNLMLNLIARGTVPGRYAAWVMPGAAAVEAAPVEALAPGNGNGVGQIDVYEAALDGLGDIEQDLEAELERMSGMGADDGIFSDEGVFGEYLQTPLGAVVEEAYAGMGAQVEEAFAGGGSGGVGEYLETPMGEYLETPMGAEVEEAFAGMGEYLETPLSGMGGMGEYLETPMGAMVEEAYAGMGQDNGFMQEFESSLASQPLMPGFRSAVQQLVRKRVAAGQPLDDAFYSKLGRAAAQLARKKFRRRVAQVQGRPIDLPVTQPRPRLTRRGAPMYKRPVAPPPVGRVPGAAEPIAAADTAGGEGIFFNGGEGIL
jgi:hypothetical protein